jgi:hypothetical protein
MACSKSIEFKSMAVYSSAKLFFKMALSVAVSPPFFPKTSCDILSYTFCVVVMFGLVPNMAEHLALAFGTKNKPLSYFLSFS